jgi:DNA-binding MarR family transcriptional regulator
MAPPPNRPARLATDLANAMTRLRSRLRAESGLGSAPWSRSQLTALNRVVYGSPSTTSDLAAAEYMRPQSMAQTVGTLEKDGLVERRADPDDGRRILIVATDKGRREAEYWTEAREAWLTAAIENTLDEDEVAALPPLVRIMERLADADAPPFTPPRSRASGVSS